MRPLRLLLPLLLLAACCVVPTAAQAKTVNIVAGIGDQNAAMFTNPLYLSLHLKQTRYFIPWDAIDDPSALAKADAFVAAASKAKVSVLMHISTNDFEPEQAKLPSVSQYNRKVGALVNRYRPRGVREWGAWNEANHRTQPTFDNPKRAAQFYLSMRKLCPGCKIVALDVLYSLNLRPYFTTWFKTLPRKERARALTIGIHQYTDPNDNSTKATSTTIRVLRKISSRTRFWITETGGLAFVRLAGTQRIQRTCSLTRQAAATKRTFAVAKAFDKDVERMYTYSWTGTDCTGFDAGLVNADGTRRPALTEFAKGLKAFKR
jgi:hypothetical protein